LRIGGTYTTKRSTRNSTQKEVGAKERKGKKASTKNPTSEEGVVSAFVRKKRRFEQSGKPRQTGGQPKEEGG